MTRLALPILLLCFPLAACERAADLAPGFLTDDREVVPATAVQADSLVAEGGARISITGTVVEQDGDGRLLIDDGTGLIHVEIPEEMPLLTGHRLLASGTLEERDGIPLLQAHEWLYDSTAVPVHSD